ncbi:MAG: nitrate reductase associated protein [Calothrix sp. MO_167.B42]|nr:nitrate reductase associated protein [Calothrix sp. MO_167.B42]
MGNFFKFESDFVNTLHCIPMQIRMNLDTCGIKLKLAHWNQLSDEERQTLVEKPCGTESEIVAYSNFLQGLVVEKTGSPASEIAVESAPPWMNATNIPATTKQKAAEFGIDIAIEQWAQLTPLQRFALIKLSRPSHENKNFYPALEEFGLVHL